MSCSIIKVVIGVPPVRIVLYTAVSTCRSVKANWKTNTHLTILHFEHNITLVTWSGWVHRRASDHVTISLFDENAYAPLTAGVKLETPESSQLELEVELELQLEWDSSLTRVYLESTSSRPRVEDMWLKLNLTQGRIRYQIRCQIQGQIWGQVRHQIWNWVIIHWFLWRPWTDLDSKCQGCIKRFHTLPLSPSPTTTSTQGFYASICLSLYK